ncbi:response regulator [bacterium]|nr:response regulator [bacterium]
MIAQKKLLVVDDESVVCQSCSRIFADQGFTIDTSTSPLEGLQLATDNDYAAILLDIKMPEMDGIEFLGELRKKNHEIPVMMITGYSSIPSAAAAMRLGAKDYIPKPFTPDEIIEAVERILQEDEEPELPADTPVESELNTTPASPPPLPILVESEGLTIPAVDVDETFPATADYYFYNRSWMQLRSREIVRTGAFLSTSTGKTHTRVDLPCVGDKVYQGLPLAQFQGDARNSLSIPSPVTGEVIAMNHALHTQLESVWENPCKDAWIALIRPDRLQEDLTVCKTRNAVILTVHEDDWRLQAQSLHRYGCRVQYAKTYEQAKEHLEKDGEHILLLDSASFGISGPHIARLFNHDCPSLNVVVLRDKDNCRETQYRMTKMFYYAIEPFSDHEIIDILDGAFCPQSAPANHHAASSLAPKWITRLQITNRNGHTVSLVPRSPFLLNTEGVGQELIKNILDHSYPLQIHLSATADYPACTLADLNGTEKVVVLENQQMHRAPGSMQFETEARIPFAGKGGKLTTCIAIQPAGEKERLTFDATTNRALAEHILKEMSL